MAEQVIVECVDDVKEAFDKASKLKEKGKNAGFTEVRYMLNPPQTRFKYCVFYFKE